MEARKAELYRKLNEIVDEMVRLENEADPETPCMATAHVLVIGMEGYDHAVGHMASPTMVCPANGRQPTWKTSGLLNMAKAYLEVDHICETG
jgi:hypothetical protein